MPHVHTVRLGRAAFRAAIAAALLAAAGCGGADRLGPAADGSAERPVIEVSAVPTTAAVPPGIVFASFALTPAQLSTVHTGIVGPSSPSALLSYLSQVKAKGGRVLIKLSGGEKGYRNADNTFNLDKWKTAVAKFRSVNFSPYITDGTIVGHFIIDEPQFPSRWGNHVIPQATVEAAAQYSKQLWPTLPTVVNAPANWLAASTVTYTGLDAGWAMFRAGTSGSPSTWVANQASKARQKGLGLFAGLNLLDGGDGSSGFHGNLPSRWAMSAAEVRSYGTALLSQSYLCGFGMWEYDATYYGRADVKAALSDISARARSHAATSCRQ